MSKIIGVTVGTTISPKSIREKLNPVLSVNGTKPDADGNVEILKGATSWNDLTDKPDIRENIISILAELGVQFGGNDGGNEDVNTAELDKAVLDTMILE